MSNIKFINQAQKMLTEDYKSRHTAEYNSWLIAHKNSWMQPHTIVPFPPFVISGALAPFKAVVTAPTEEEIVAKALELYNESIPTPIAKEVVHDIEPMETLNQPVDDEQTLEVVDTQTSEVDDTQTSEVVDAEELEELEELVEPTVVVLETPVIEPIVEELTESNNVEAISEEKPHVDEIHKIYQTSEPKPMGIEERFAEFKAYTAMEEALQVVPQPSEELAKVSKPGKIFPSVMEKLQSMTAKWSTNGGSNV
jgi:hypothetical protein